MQATISPDARFTARDLGLGAISGLGGGLAMGVVGMIVAALHGFSVWQPLAEIAGVFDSTVLQNSTGFSVGAVALGTLIHFGISAVLGMLFALLYRGAFNMPSSMMIFPFAYGFIFGLVIWFISSQLLSNIPISGREYTPSFIVQHLVFGSVTGVLFGLLRPVRAYLPRYR